MDDVLPKTKLSLQIEKWRRRQCSLLEANIKFSYFSGTRKRRCHCDERLRHEWSTYRWRYCYMLPLEAANTWAVSWFEDKDLHRFVRFGHLNLHFQPKPEEPQEDHSKMDISNHQDDVTNHLHKFAGVILKAGHVGQSQEDVRISDWPKLVKLPKPLR